MIDLGSGKGYLSTHLSLQHGLPVIGIDSQPHNTSGATRRAEKLGRQWNSLVKFEEKKSQKVEVSKTSLEVEASKEKDGFHYEPYDCSVHKATVQTGIDIISDSKSELRDDTCELMCDYLQGQDRSSNSRISHPQATGETSKADQKAEFLDENQIRKSKPAESFVKSQADRSKLLNQRVCFNENHTDSDRSKCARNYIAITTFVSPDTKLTDLVKKSAECLCPDKACENMTLRSLLTGLHTCGSLAPSMLRLFIQDDAVRALCGVGCCYQLMQERFLDESGYWQGPHCGMQGSRLSCREMRNRFSFLVCLCACFHVI